MENLLLSKYVKKIEVDQDEHALYNTYNGAVLLFPCSYFEGQAFIDSKLTIEEKETLFEYKFFKNNEEEIYKAICGTYFQETNAMALSIEVNLLCNLACSYCYQNGLESRKEISVSVIDDICNYLEKTIIEKKIAHLKIGLIGGEPLLSEEKVSLLLSRIRKITLENRVALNLVINTNAVFLNEIFLNKIESLGDSITIYVPLTNKEDHDNLRKTKSGQGTYDIVLNNLIKLNKYFLTEKVNLEIRYNTNASNKLEFESFLKELKKSGLNIFKIEPMFTFEHSQNIYKNKLSFKDFSIWNATEAIDLLISNGFYIHNKLASSCVSCKAYRENNFKIFSDGKVGLCDASVYKESAPYISEFVGSNGAKKSFNLENKMINPFKDSKCNACSDIIMCGGKFFCREECQYSSVDISLFLKNYIKYFRQNKHMFFVNM